MPTYAYIGHAMDGSQVRGTIEAQHPEDAREQLRKKGLLVEEVSLAPDGNKSDMLHGDKGGYSQKSSPVTVATSVTSQAVSASPATSDTEDYVPLSDTFRLYAGWLLAWYGLVFLLGSYQFTKRLPFEIPFVESLFQSPLVLKFAFGTFLFLLLSSVHRLMGRGMGKGIALTIVWFVVMTLFALNG